MMLDIDSRSKRRIMPYLAMILAVVGLSLAACDDAPTEDEGMGETGSTLEGGVGENEAPAADTQSPTAQ